MRTILRTICVGLVLAVPAVSSAADYLPGGEATKKAVATRSGKTPLSRLAASMAPGTWAKLETEVPQGLWSSPKLDGGRNAGGRGGLHIAGWTDDAHWDSRTGQFFYMGLRQTRRFIAYSEEKNQWRSIDLDFTSDNPVAISQFGHIYSNNGFDHERSRFYHRYGGFKDEKKGLDLKGGVSYFDAVTEKWTKLPGEAPGGMSIEYFNAADGLVHLGKQVQFFSEARQRWEPAGDSPVDGYHSLFRHNPYREEVLMTGGNNARQIVARLKKDGTVERLKDAPIELGVRGDKITLDPNTGRYLILGVRGDEGRKGFEFDSDLNEYRPIESLGSGWPFNRNAMPVCAFIPEYGVTMWADGDVYLYKPESVSSSAQLKRRGE